MNREEQYIRLAESEVLCTANECQLKQACLRWILRDYIPAERLYVKALNPRHHWSEGNECTAFRSAQTSMLARGFKHLYDNMQLSKVLTVSKKLQSLFTPTGYYRLKRGDRPLTTAERRRIEEVCRAAGVTEPIEFDTWEEGIE